LHLASEIGRAAKPILYRWREIQIEVLGGEPMTESWAETRKKKEEVPGLRFEKPEQDKERVEFLTVSPEFVHFVRYGGYRPATLAIPLSYLLDPDWETKARAAFEAQRRPQANDSASAPAAVE
jgi:hypothetical protein